MVFNIHNNEIYIVITYNTINFLIYIMAAQLILYGILKHYFLN